MQFINLIDKKILVRVDFNVPLDKDLKVTDDTRIKESIPTIKYLLELTGTSIILLAHLDRPLKKLLPDGSIDIKKYSLRNILPVLSELLEKEVLFADDCTGDQAKAMAKALKPGEVLLLENTRFHAGEEKGEEEFSKNLASLGDAYINDAFGAAHRAHASTCVIASYFPKDSKAFGFLMKKELASARRLLINPERPYTAIIGGAKVSDKILLLEKMIQIVDNLVIGGGMAYTFLKAMGGHVGKSLVEEDRISNAKEILRLANGKIKLCLPADSIAAEAFSNEVPFTTVNSMEIPDNLMGLDIGPLAIEEFSKIISGSRSILWNGPMGVFEMSNFANGTFEIAKVVAHATKHGAFSLVGGGDSAAAIHKMKLESEVSFVSTGGGAMLELLEGKELPGVKAILEG